MKTAGRLIAPSTLARLANLQLLARVVVDGGVRGLHRSPRFGFSQEFAEFRAYSPGDDLRFIDWNVFARSDRLFVKRFFGDTNARVMVLLDASASMAMAGGPDAVSKLDYGRFLAAALIYLATRQHDAVGLAAFADDVRIQRPPRSGRGVADGLFHLLDGLRPRGRTDWLRSIDSVGRRLPGGSLVIVISDFYCEPEALAPALQGLHVHGHDLLVLQVLDPGERRPAPEDTTFEDVETGERMAVSADYLRDAYPDRLAQHLAAMRRVTLAARGHYRVMPTDAPLDEALAAYLRFRERHP
jgi:uncharacterized protein (DUF58 family)